MPFWLSAVIVLIGYIIRRNPNETPVFEEEQRGEQVAKMPLNVLFKRYPADVLRVVFCALVSTISAVLACSRFPMRSTP